MWSRLLRIVLPRAVVLGATLFALDLNEGVGDKATDVPTGEIGVTQSARDAVGGSRKLSDREVAKAYLGLLYDRWERVEGFREAPSPVQEALLDLSYNLGEGVMEYRGIRKSLKQGDWHSALVETLDTASVGGKGLRGLAVRRAKNYNKAVVSSFITMVEQREDGTIVYHKTGGEFFKYKPKRGVHEKSAIGTVLID